MRQLDHFYRADKELALKVAEGLGSSILQPKSNTHKIK